MPTRISSSRLSHSGYFTRGNTGFTLVEIMTVLFIVSVLAVLVFALLRDMTDRGMATRCVGNLRQIGVAILAYSSEYGGEIPARIERDPEDPGKNDAKTYWYRILQDKGYLPPNTTSRHNVFLCPSMPLVKGVGTNYQTYGFRVWRAPGSSVFLPQNLLFLEKPSDFFLVVDSYISVFNSQGYYVAPNSEWKIHLRHYGQEANTLFADGHVAAKGTEYFDRISEEQKVYADTGGSFRYELIKTP